MDEDIEKNCKLVGMRSIDPNSQPMTGRCREGPDVDEVAVGVDLDCESPKVQIRNPSPQPEAYAAVVAELKSVIVDANRREEIKKRVRDEEFTNPGISPTRKTSNTISPGGKKPSISRKNSENPGAASAARNKINQEVNFLGFEKLKPLKSVSMSLDWVNFKIKSESGEELFQAVQSKFCSLSVTGRNELFLRKMNAENVLRIHSSVEEDARNFNFYTPLDKHVGTVSCNVRQTFKVPSTIKNRISGRTYNVTVQHGEEGASKFWQVEEIATDLPIASVKVQIGHRWKSVYTLTFIQETSISTQILIVGFLLALASARLESEVVPAFFAFSAVLLTFIIFFIIQFT